MIILDASVLYPLAKLSRDRVTTVADRLLREGATVLDLTLYEVANAAIIEARRGVIREPQRLVKAVSRLAEYLSIIRIEAKDLEAISKLAEELDLTAYDSAYIHYARKYKAKLLTNDKEILMKADDVAVSLDAWLRDNKEDLKQRP